MYMADVMYIFASQTTLEVLMGPQSLVGQLLGGGISSKLQRGGVPKCWGGTSSSERKI